MADRSIWKPIRTVPRDTLVRLKTVRGIVCTGLVPKHKKVRPADAWGPKRIDAYRRDAKVKTGDIRAVAWR
jgi:hypothetical protein